MRGVLRTVGVPLLAYHALILAGAAVLVAGFVRRAPFWEAMGALLIVLGIGVEAAILAWSARLTRRATVARAAPDAARTGGGTEGFCLRCGYVGSAGPTVCRRCGGPSVRRVRSPDPRAVGDREAPD